LTARSRPPAFDIFPSSQPSPSKTPTVPRQSQSRPQARCIPGLNDVPPIHTVDLLPISLVSLPFRRAPGQDASRNSGQLQCILAH
jgi:hypothetical protein